LGTPSYVLS